MTSKVVISCAGKRAGSLSINTVSLPLFRFHASVCIVPFWQEKGPTNSRDMSFLESNSLPLLAYHEFWKKIWKILHWRSTTILFLLACYVWSVESDHNQLVGCSTSVWNSHLSSLKGRRSFSSGGWTIERSLFKETQLGPGESALSCCSGLQHKTQTYFTQTNDDFVMHHHWVLRWRPVKDS